MMQIVFIFIFVDSSWSKRQLFIKSFLQCERWRNFADKKRLWTSIDLQNLRANLKNSFKKKADRCSCIGICRKRKISTKNKREIWFWHLKSSTQLQYESSHYVVSFNIDCVCANNQIRYTGLFAIFQSGKWKISANYLWQ